MFWGLGVFLLMMGKMGRREGKVPEGADFTYVLLFFMIKACITHFVGLALFSPTFWARFIIYFVHTAWSP